MQQITLVLTYCIIKIITTCYHSSLKIHNTMSPFSVFGRLGNVMYYMTLAHTFTIIYVPFS